MNVLDLFSGIGGFSLAAHWMGWETAAFVEKEPFCHKVLAKNFPGVPILGDIYEFSTEPFRGSIDIITGGFPCQPFSVAGRRNGVNDERYLFPETLRVIAEVNPTWVVLENVTGLLTMAQSSETIRMARQTNHQTPERDVFEAIYTREEEMLLNSICEELEKIGYSVQPVVVPALAVGAPHKRDRVWILAHSESQRPRKTRGLRPDESTERITGSNKIGGTASNAKHDGKFRPEKPGFNTSAQQKESAGSIVFGDEFAGSDRRRTATDGTPGTTADADNAGSGTSGRDIDANRTEAVGERKQSLAEFSGQGSVITDSASARLSQPRQPGIGKLSTKVRKRMDNRLELGSSVIAHAERDGRRTRGVSQYYNGGQRTICSSLRHNRHTVRSDFEQRGCNQWRENWRDVAARTCVRGVDDGIPDELDIIGSRDNRNARLKALGNSIVPQIAFQIFKAIEKASVG